MSLEDLKRCVTTHSGTFHCVMINDESKSKDVSFKHVFDFPGPTNNVPNLGQLQEFYTTFGSLTLYYDTKSGEAAYHLAKPDQWEELRREFLEWMTVLDKEERNEFLPDWIEDFIVIGKIPQSGNYLLVPKIGKVAGHIFEFEHDGIEFIELAQNIDEFVRKSLSLDSHQLSTIASHMRFIETDPLEQWWISEMHDSRGISIETKV